MTFAEKFRSSSERNRSLLCVGLDPDVEKLPRFLGADPESILRFNREMIEATSDLVCAYKMNLAFYAAYGVTGWRTLEETVSLVPSSIPTILDAKFGDTGNTSRMYATTAFETLGVDAVTVNPYMGSDAVLPFLEHDGKCAFVLCLNSNPGAADFQVRHLDGKPFYLRVAEKAVEWYRIGTCGLVVGATYPDRLRDIRSTAPDLPFLIPGVGAQGGDLGVVLRDGRGSSQAPVIISTSRAVIYASSGADFAEAARRAAEGLRERMNSLLEG
ncbi:MAG: orotidine-5'-phosphate decarboxylase [Candidatus Latescibacteria bacterium]|nr:orotidine-5'-phosphate decarboxylase [Candidatus Latescibacterota bacterium]